jgi:hypothetical protein
MKGAEVVAEMESMFHGEISVHETDVMIEETIAEPIVTEQPSQEELQGVTHRVSLASELAKINSESLNLAVVRDEYDADIFDENLDDEQHVEENDELASSESDEENMQTSVDTAPNAPVDPGGEGNEANVPFSVAILCDVPTSSHNDWGSYYADKKLRALKLKHISLQDYLNHKDISHIGFVVCDSALVGDEGNPRVREKVIKKDQLFELVDAVKLIFLDYIVRLHRPLYVAQSCHVFAWLRRFWPSRATLIGATSSATYLCCSVGPGLVVPYVVARLT